MTACADWLASYLLAVGIWVLHKALNWREER